jgi:hypothetical protein
MLKTIYRSDQVAVDQVARVPIVSRMNAWLRRGLDQEIDWSDGREIIAHANVAMREFNTACLQPSKRQLRPTAS